MCSLGAPLHWHNVSGREMQRVVTKAGVKKIKLHGLRHTSASLLLSAGVPPHVVQRRLGHASIVMTSVYRHCLPTQQADAAERLAKLLHG